MIQYQRKQEILKLLHEEHSLKIADIAKRIFASESSVRRDLEDLEKEGYIHRVYGGAVLAEEKNDILPLKLRDSQNSSKKSLIAKKASDLVFDGAVIIMDSSSTVRRMCKYITRFKNLKIVTNSVNLLAELDENTHTVYCTGGKLNKSNNVFVGSAAVDFLSKVNADILFFSSQSLSEDGCVTDSSEEESAIRRVMLRQAKKKVFLCDSTKIGDKKMFGVCHVDDVDVIICDTELPFEKNKSNG